MNYLKKKTITKILVSISLASCIILLIDTKFFSIIFKFYNINHLIPSFADFRSYQALPLTIENDLNPYVDHKYDPWNRPFNLPIIWFYIVDYFNLVEEINFKVFILFYISSFIYCILKIISITESFIAKIFTVLTTLSSSTILAIERGNTDILIFSLIFLACFLKKSFSIFVLFCASILKLYPIFCLIINFDNKKKIIISIVSVFLILIILGNNLNYFFYNTHSSFNSGISYGIRAIILGFFKSIERLGFGFIEENDFNYNIIFLIFLLFSLSIFLFTFIKKNNYPNINFLDIKNRLFLAGGSVYCFSFIFFSSFDYRLIFLIMTFPYLVAEVKGLFLKTTTFFLILLSTNSTILYSLATIKNDYVYIGIVNHTCKLILYFILLNELSKFLKKSYIRLFYISRS